MGGHTDPQTHKATAAAVTTYFNSYNQATAAATAHAVPSSSSSASSMFYQCLRDYTGVHYLGGRFLPKKMQDRLGLTLPLYDMRTPTQLYKYPPLVQGVAALPAAAPAATSTTSTSTTSASSLTDSGATTPSCSSCSSCSCASSWVLYVTEEGFPYYHQASSGDSRWATFSPPPSASFAPLPSPSEEEEEG